MGDSRQALFDALHQLGRIYNDTRQRRQAIGQAEKTLAETIRRCGDRTSTLLKIAELKNNGLLSDEAHQRLLVTVANILRSQGAFLRECDRVLFAGDE